MLISRMALSLFNWHRKFVNDYSSCATPLYRGAARAEENLGSARRWRLGSFVVALHHPYLHMLEIK